LGHQENANHRHTAEAAFAHPESQRRKGCEGPLESGEISEVRQGGMGSVRNRLGSEHSAEVFGGAGGAGLAECVQNHFQSQEQAHRPAMKHAPPDSITRIWDQDFVGSEMIFRFSRERRSMWLSR
jgi:hypothetical protein